MKPDLSGLLVPITTPYDPVTGDVAPVPLRGNARALLDAGADGIVAAGSTGEAPLLSESEYRRIVGWMRDVVPDDRWLIAGAGRESTRATITACVVAAEEGADAVLVRPPAYYGPALTTAALLEHFRRVADQSPVRVLLYNIPKYTHLSLSDRILAGLAEHPNVAGAKDSSGDLKNFAAYRDAAPAWAMFVGSGSHYYAALELGAAGGILAVANLAATIAVGLHEAFVAGDKTRAGAAQERLTPLNRAVVVEHGVAGVKAAMDIVGLQGGPVRAPLSDLADGERDSLHRMLRAAGLSEERAGDV